MVGGIALLWLASYAIGIPFKYGLAGALLAISAVLFAEWDQGSRARRARNSRTNLAVGLALCSAAISCLMWTISTGIHSGLVACCWLSLLSFVPIRTRAFMCKTCI